MNDVVAHLGCYCGGGGECDCRCRVVLGLSQWWPSLFVVGFGVVDSMNYGGRRGLWCCGYPRY